MELKPESYPTNVWKSRERPKIYKGQETPAAHDSEPGEAADITLVTGLPSGTAGGWPMGYPYAEGDCSWHIFGRDLQMRGTRAIS